MPMEMDDGPVDGFCGDATGAMYMNGFQSAFSRQSTCLALYINAFTLDTAVKFIVAMFGVLALGILAEALVAFRRSRARDRRKATRASAKMPSARTPNMATMNLTAVSSVNALM